MSCASNTGKRDVTEAFWGNDVQWNPNDFIPAWVALDELPFPTAAGNSICLPTDPGYLSLYINNDNTNSGAKIYTMNLENTTLGFSRETYLLQESWDLNPGNPGNDVTITNATLLSEAGYAPVLPQLLTGGPSKTALIVIMDADGPSTEFGDNGNNVFVGSAFADVYFARQGADTVTAGNGDDVVRGQAGDDWLSGQVGDDILLGEEGNDALFGGQGIDALYGGSGDDQLTGAQGSDILDGMDGNDVLRGGASVDVLIGGFGNDTLFAAAGVSSGGVLPNNANWLFGDAGDDFLYGGFDADLLDGGEGSDRLEGGGGDDTYVVDSYNDVIVEAAGTGIETVETTISWILAPELENLILQGEADNGFGNALNNSISGNSRSNYLVGYDGNDNLRGGFGGGNDTLDGGNGNDTYSVDSLGDEIIDVAGIDTVRAEINWILAENLENLELNFSSATNGTGNALDNTITGGFVANTLDGRGGNDVLIGGSGADTLRGGNGGDRFTFTSRFDGTDRIEDFNRSQGDKIRIAAGFDSFGPVTISRFAYNASTGVLSYTNTGSTTQLAVLVGAPSFVLASDLEIL